MTCQEFDNLLHPYVDGEFDEGERHEAEAHLGACEGCLRRVQAARGLKLAARRAEQYARAPEALRGRIQQQLRLHERRRRVRGALSFASAAAVLCAAGAVVWGLWPRARDRFVHDAARYHARPLPHEIAAPAHDEVEAWFGGKLDHRVPVPRLAGASIAGARISNVQDRQAAYIRYQKPDATGAHRTIGLFVFGDVENDVDASPLPAVEVEQRLGYNVALWRDGEIVYELVSDLDEGDIRALLEGPLRPQAPRTAPAAVPSLDVRPASLRQ